MILYLFLVLYFTCYLVLLILGCFVYYEDENKSKQDLTILIYHGRYKLWRKGKYLGTGIWTKDLIIGDSFQNMKIDKEGNKTREVFIADKWELIISKEF